MNQDNKQALDFPVHAPLTPRRPAMLTKASDRLLWLPLLQFDGVDMSLQPAMAQVAAELAGVFDAWELWCWLAAPNSSLDDRAPFDVLLNDPDAVLQAARVDRFIACG